MTDSITRELETAQEPAPAPAGEAASAAAPVASAGASSSPETTTAAAEQPAPAEVEVASTASDAPVSSAAEKPAAAPEPIRVYPEAEFHRAAPKRPPLDLGALTAKASRYKRPAVAAGALLVAGGLGFVAGRPTAHRPGEADLSASHLSEAVSTMRQAHDENVRIAAEMRALKISVDALKAERAKSDLSAKQAQLAERTDKLGAELTTRLAKVADSVERIEKTQRDPSRLGALSERLERIEKHVAGGATVAQAGPAPAPASAASASPTPPSTPTPPPKPVASVAEPAQTGSIPDARTPAKPPETDPRKQQVEGYALRDVDDGFALIEARNGRLIEVGPGSMVPGVGRVEAIERRGRHWVVVTPKGYIGER